MSGTFRMSQQRFRLKTKETIQSSRKLLKSTRKMADRIETISENYMQIIKEEILSNNSVSREQDLTFSIILKLTKAFKLCEKINSDFYPYKTI